jgi:predicted Zn-dependent protease
MRDVIALSLAVLVVFAASKADDESPESSGQNRSFLYCAPGFDPSKLENSKAPLLQGLGNLHYEVTTKNKVAQQYFNQGLTLSYAFNHGEAARSFKEVTQLDSTCAMGYWGLAFVLGPNYNAALNPTSLDDINDALNKAVFYSKKASKLEQGLINALAKRYPKEEVQDMTPYATAYAEELKQLYEKFPGDMQVATLYAEALMNLHPWNLWMKDGSAQPWTAEIQQLLEEILKKDPSHPGANHYYIHVMEASREAHKALRSADTLRNLLPAAGHLVHMPSHIYIRTGNYHEGVLANIKASAADSTYITQCKVQGTYPMLYYPHNIHFLAACAFFEGNSKQAIESAWSVSANADKRYLHESVTVQHYYIIPYYVLVHLGKWDDILKLDKPGESLKYPLAIWHYSRGMAFAAKGNLVEAIAEFNVVSKLSKDEELKSMLIWESNSAFDLVNIASYTLRAEIAMHQKQYDKSIDLLKKAIEIEDRLNYTEPPDWFFSVRHSLGNVLLKAGRYEQAEKIYKEDLETFPENGWALRGLQNSLEAQNKTAEAEEVKKRFEKAWQWADFEITTSRVD